MRRWVALALALVATPAAALEMRQQSTSTYHIPIFMVQSSDHVTGLTGATLTCTASKNAGAFGAVSGAVTEISSGWYKLAGNATDTNTLGTLAIHCTATSADPSDLAFLIVAFDPFDAVRLGQTALPNVASGSAGAIPTTGTGANQISVSNGQVILQTGTGTGQLDFTSGVVKANAVQLLGTAWLTPGTAGTPDVNAKLAGGTAWGSGAITAGSIAASALNGKGDWMVSYTQPTGFLAATFPATVASPTNITAGTMTTCSTCTATTTVNGLAANVVTAAAIADGAIDRATFAADTGLQSVQSGTASAGGASTITIATALGADSLPNGETIVITGGTGIGQVRGITGYVNATKVVTVDRAWTTNPDATSTYAILPVSVAKLDTSSQVTAASVQGNVTGSVGSVTGLTASNLDTTVSSRMATYTQPTGFLAATFPTTVASTTNITAGTITTATNLTNLPSIPANWITAAGITASALNGKGDWMVSYTQPTGFLAATFPSGTIANTTNITAGTITTATNLTNAPTNGDLTATMKTSVQTAAAAALITDTYAEPGQGAPAATASLKDKLGYLYKSWRNRKTQTTTTFKLYNDDATTVDQKATCSDDGTTTDVGEQATGP